MNQGASSKKFTIKKTFEIESPIRERRLRADFRKLQKFIQQSDLIRIEKMEGEPPESYQLCFTCKGIAQLGLKEPVYSEEHRVAITFPLDYPMKKPRMRWLTPIFHPNINEEGTYVCIDVWYPGKFLDDLCMTLGRMIQYKNYNAENYIREDAAKWSARCAHLFPVDTRPLRRGIPDQPAHDTLHETLDIRVL